MQLDQKGKLFVPMQHGSSRLQRMHPDVLGCLQSGPRLIGRRGVGKLGAAVDSSRLHQILELSSSPGEKRSSQAQSRVDKVSFYRNILREKVVQRKIKQLTKEPSATAITKKSELASPPPSQTAAAEIDRPQGDVSPNRPSAERCSPKVKGPQSSLEETHQTSSKGKEFYWEIEFHNDRRHYDSDPFVYEHLLWRFTLSRRPNARGYGIKLVLLSPVTAVYHVSCIFKLHCMLRPSYSREAARPFSFSPQQKNSGALDPFISASDLISYVHNNRLLLSGKLNLVEGRLVDTDSSRSSEEEQIDA